MTKSRAEASAASAGRTARRLRLRDRARQLDPARIVRRLVMRGRRAARLGWRAAGQGLSEFYRSDNLTFSASIAYYTLLSLFPFLLLVISILSRLAGRSDPRGATLLSMVENALPSNFDFLAEQVRILAQTPLNLSLAGTLVTLWASMGVFGAITSAVNHAWGVEKSYGFFTHKLMAFLMMMAAGALAIVALTLMSATQVVEANWFSVILVNFPELQLLSSWLWNNAATLMFILVVGLVYYFVPNAKVRLRDVWVGAILAGVLWRLAFDLFAWYIRDLSRFSVHGSVAAVVLFLIWIYVSAAIVLYGVEVTAAYARLRKHLPPAAPAAPALDE
jgi:membrane protein